MIQITVNPGQLSELNKALKKLEKTLNFNNLKVDVLNLLQADVDERFDSSPGVESGGVVYGGAVWPRLTEGYLKSNPRRRGGQIGRDTGEMAQSLTIGGRGNITEVNPREVVFGSSLPKAIFFDAQRPLLFIHDELADNIARIIALRIQEALNE